ncbi:putative cellulose synthase-like protein D6 [Cardamine amara subsp. amara]|uniref:Cellulose synthase-like protein D6 n=1 Tax=Cardamine amara subsp. amara TaxID=228776 RepID=A0ABD0ZCY0_CARAN
MFGGSSSGPRISTVSASSSDFGSCTEFTNYVVTVPPTPDNNPEPGPAQIPIVKQDIGSGSPNKDQESDDETDLRISEEHDTLLNKISHPLTRIVKISPIIIAIYRILIVVRVLSLGLFLLWRVRNPNKKAIWLWFLSVICEIWFAFSWLLDQIPKLFPVNHATDIEALKVKFESPNENNPTGKSDLPGIDVFVSTADAEKEPPLVTANTILSILSVDYPIEKLSCYISDDGGSLLTFEAMAEAASFAKIWVPFCRKHKIEPRNPESYFGLKRDPYKDKVRHDFVRERRYVKRGYEEFKVRVNALSNSIRRRSDAFNSKEEIKALEKWKNWKVKVEEDQDKEPRPPLVAPKATWMSDGTYWPGTWAVPCLHHSRGDHASVIQVLLDPPENEMVKGTCGNESALDFEEVDMRLPMLVYVSREKRPGYEHNKKAGAMNALVRASAIMSNGPFILNLDCDHYVYNSRAFRDGICFMMDSNGDRVCYVQFPQRFEGIDKSDRYANKNTVFFDINLRALDGIQGPMYVGTGCLFRRTALYGFGPPDYFMVEEKSSGCCGLRNKNRNPATVASEPVYYIDVEDEDQVDISLIPKQFGSSSMLVNSVKVAEFQGRPLTTAHSSRRGRPPGSLTGSREPLDYATVNEAVNVISCWYEDKTEWGVNVGWIYGSVTEDVVTGFRMHEKGWRSFYCVTEPDAFRGSAPINLTDRLHQVLRWATGSVEIFFSRNNAIFAGRKLKLLQRIAYLNVGIYPFTSIFILTYCFLPPLSLFSGHFVVQTLTGSFLLYLLIITLSLCGLAILEVKWSGITLEEWWRNEQFWLIGGTSAHIVAVLQGILKVIAGIEISFTLTSKSSTGDDEDDDFADLYLFKWTALMIPPLTIIILNIVAILFAVCRTVFTDNPQWSNLLGGTFFAGWVLLHMYPFAKGLMGRRGRTPTVVYVWSGLIAICFSLLYVTIKNSEIDGGSFVLT